MDYSGIIIERNDKKILFQLRDNNPRIPNPNLWSIFGGGIEEGESPREAAVRELKEELGLNINKKQLRLLVIFPTFKKKSYIFKLSTIKKLSGLRLQEGAAMKYFSREELIKKENVVPSLRTLLRVYPLISLFR